MKERGWKFIFTVLSNSEQLVRSGFSYYLRMLLLYLCSYKADVAETETHKCTNSTWEDSS